MKHLLVVSCLLSVWPVYRGEAQTLGVGSADAKTAAPAPWAVQNRADMAGMEHGMFGAPVAGNEDQAFVQGMIPHHQGAVDMAKVELAYGHDPRMKELARSIVAAQEHEMQIMREWQQTHPNAS